MATVIPRLRIVFEFGALAFLESAQKYAFNKVGANLVKAKSSSISDKGTLHDALIQL